MWKCAACNVQNFESTSACHKCGHVRTAEEIAASPPSPELAFPERGRFKNTHSCFYEVTRVDGSLAYFAGKTALQDMASGLRSGELKRTDPFIYFAQDANQQWTELKNTLAVKAKNEFALNQLYTPIWAHAREGLNWGIMVGIGLKVLDTGVTLFMVDEELGLAFLVLVVGTAMGALPSIFKYVPFIAWFFVFKLGVGFVMLGAIFGAALSGAVLGCLPGMALGGIVGLIRQSNLPRAADLAPTDHDANALTVVVLPIAGAISIGAAFILWFMPWLMEMMAGL